MQQIRSCCCFVLFWFFLTQTVQAIEIGDQAPSCLLTSLDHAQNYPLQKYSGQVLYVDFWASWCPPCAKSFAFMNSLFADFTEQGLNIIAINLDEQAEDAQTFLAKYPARFTLASSSNQQCAKDFNVPAMPTSYVVDHNGIIRYIHLGFRAGETQQIREHVQQLLTERAASAAP